MTFDLDVFKQIVGPENVLTNEPMSKHTTYRIGGPCDVMLKPVTTEQVVSILKVCRQMGVNCFVLGNGSNLLVRDGGIRGVVLNITSYMSDVEVEGNCITAGAGALLGHIVKYALEASLSGLEFATGIPGSFGGAVAMNAGAYGGDMKSVLKKVTAVDGEGNIVTLSRDELDMGYRKSAVRSRGLVMLEGELELVPKAKEEIKTKMEELGEKRRRMQPLWMPSCGSVFKRPEGYFIGKLIEEAGLKGTRIGGAEVSQLHANFIVNRGGATAKDVLDLIEYIKKRVLEYAGIPIETEVIIVGED